MIPNKARGEVLLSFDGQSYLACLDMAALAKLEALTGADSLSALSVALSSLSASKMVDVVGVLIESGGTPAERAALMRWTPKAMSAAIQSVFEAAGMTDDGDDTRPKASPSQSPGINGSASGAATQTVAA